MATKIDQKAYLQKYLGGPSKDKKKKKKKVVKGSGLKLIDDDLDLSKLRPLDGDELDILDGGEDAPQIAGIIDERPEELKMMEQLQTSSKWKVVNEDDGFNSKLQIQEIRKDRKETEKENEIVFGKMYSDSEDEQKNDSDISPPRKNNKKNDNNSDFSPPRRGKSPENDKKYDSDVSPPRNTNKDVKIREKGRNNRERENSDFSPRRRDKSPKNDREKGRNNSDLSPARREKSPKNDKKYDSPPRKANKDSEPRKERVRKRSRWADASPERNDHSPNRKDSRRDSPKRKYQNDSPKRKYQNDSPKRKHQNDSDTSPRKRRQSKERSRKRSPSSDLSPSRKSKKDKYDSERRNRDHRKESRRKQESDSDISPPRRKEDRKHKRSPKKNSDSDLSPPRNKKDKRSNRKDSDSDLSPPRRGKESKRRNSDSPPPSNKKMAKTLEGKKAGLQDAKQLREENEQFRRKEDDVFKRLADDVSGKNAKAVSRKGKRDTSEEIQKQQEKAERQKELDAKYKVWSKGVKQVQAQQARVEDFLHEASKPLARHKDDKDLEHNLKQIERAGDPMLQYIREKKRERGELPPAEVKRAREDFLHEASKPLARHKDDKDLEHNLKQIERAGDPMLQYIREKKRERGELPPAGVYYFLHEASKPLARHKDDKDLEHNLKQIERAGDPMLQYIREKKRERGELPPAEVKRAREDFLHEASKPLARHKDDKDLEHNLKQIERAGDPMLQYIREKKRERGELPPEKPSYKGSFPPNRFNIRPGYRWDGVDRSNGYEKKFFEQQSKRKAQEEEAYKWSTEDL